MPRLNDNQCNFCTVLYLYVNEIFFKLLNIIFISCKFIFYIIYILLIKFEYKYVEMQQHVLGIHIISLI